MTYPLRGWLALVLSLTTPGAAFPAAPAESVTLRGKVVDLTKVLRASEISFDAEPVANQVVLQDNDGTVSPLLSDEASRALFLDARLRDRPAELVARRHKGLPYLQLISFK